MVYECKYTQTSSSQRKPSLHIEYELQQSHRQKCILCVINFNSMYTFVAEMKFQKFCVVLIQHQKFHRKEVERNSVLVYMMILAAHLSSDEAVDLCKILLVRGD